ncbi:F0F1 ATP synthase subunit gamma [Gracilimonas tropica]|uniref:F0F1 ATP synthase subunit gamma n=1 Tax=Gracilimonas tropica TaxID=454600 RepID=UPI00037BEF1E|nr:F0F1 ATP synthase subunit gamma [Gracilimonas tropica]
MQKLEQLQRKVSSAEELQSITRTMKVMSAVSIRQFEEAVKSLAEYFDTLELGMQIVLRTANVYSIRDLEKERDPGTGVIAVGSGQSLCGPFDEMLTSYILEKTEEMDPAKLQFYVLGERLAGHLKIEKKRIDRIFATPASVDGINDVVLALLNGIEQWQYEAGIGSILVIHNKPLAKKGFTPRTQYLLPLNKAWLDRLTTRKWPTNNIPTFTMDPEELFTALLRQYLFVSLFRAVAESLAAEYASRLAAMQRAETKIEERLEILRAEFLRERQASITEELLDIMAGFEAVKNA